MVGDRQTDGKAISIEERRLLQRRWIKVPMGCSKPVWFSDDNQTDAKTKKSTLNTQIRHR